MTKKSLLLFLFLSVVAMTAAKPGDSALVGAAAAVGGGDGPIQYRFKETGREAAPMTLTAADGTGLELKLFHAETVIQGPLAFTQLRLTFVNPEDRVREGRFRITLPEQAAISRFAMRIDDKWQEAEMVERQAARRAYEDFLHRRQDPALLEKAAGNEFRARIFPIPAKGEKELILSYSQQLVSADSYYRLNLQGLPQIADFELNVNLDQKGKRDEFVIKEKNYQPKGDFEVAGLVTDDALFDGQYLVTRVTPELSSSADKISDLLILVDTSASRALGFENQLKLVEVLTRQLDSKVTVAGFDQTVSKGNLKNLGERGALGATDLNRALEWAGKQSHSRLLLVTDGISTAGPSQLQEALKGSAIERMDVILVGGIRDRDKMELLVDQAVSREGVVLDSEMPVSELVKRLNQTVTSGLDVGVAGAEWVWPETLENLQPGDQRLVFAKISGDEIGLKVGSKELSLKPRSIDASPLLSRQAVVAQIARLESRLAATDDPEVEEQLSAKIVELSTTHRVLSEKTALLVLESDEDYASFDIDRNALADILKVEKGQLALVNRSEIFLPEPKKRPVVAEKKSKDKELVAGAQFADDGVVSEDADSPDDYGDTVESGLGGSPGEGYPQYEGVQGLIERPVEADQERRESSPEPPPAEEPAQTTSSSLTVRRDQPSPQRPAPRPAADEMVDEELAESTEEEASDAKVDRAPPLTGKFAEIESKLEAGDKKGALRMARAWQEESPGDVLALIALGNCLEAMGRKDEAARVFGSIIDLFPSRADLRRYAASRLQSLGEEPLELAVDCFQKAADQRPDHVSSHRFLAFAQARAGNLEGAMEALEAGLSRSYPNGRFRSYRRILTDDLGLIAAAWLRKEPAKKRKIYDRLKKYDAKMAKEPSLRFILTWETDANDVDFHIRDEAGGHAYYSSPKLGSGGELYGDVTTGYGPECFAIDGKAKAYPYDLEIHYYSRGPMGYGMGQLEVLRHDGKGRLSFEERPYVVMVDGAYVDLGRVED